ncbi:MAG: hypothetical protein ABFS86_04500 [Planctomycetota bacterium]
MHRVIYRARPGADVEQAMKVLLAAGLHPYLLDDAKPDIFTWIATMGTMRIRVAVPEEEAEEAAKALTDWEAETAPRAAALAKQFERQALVFCVVAAAVGLILWLLLG